MVKVSYLKAASRQCTNVSVAFARWRRCASDLIHGPVCRCSAPAVWNSLPQTVLSSDSVAVFKLRLRTFLFSQVFSSFSAQ